MIHITDHISLDESELHWDYIRSSGPGGQNINKVASAVQLRFDAGRSPSLSPEVKERLRKAAGKTMTSEGVIVITARRFRYQARNRVDALERLIALVQKAASPPKRRIRTAPSQGAREKRLIRKKQLGIRKRERKRPSAPLEE